MKGILMHWQRVMLAVMGLVAIVLALSMPMIQEEYVEQNEAQDYNPVLQSGEVLEQQLTVTGKLNQFSLRVGNVKEAKGITLEVKLVSADKSVAETEFSLAKVRNKGRLIYDLPQQLPAGNYFLQVKAQGEGNVSLCGGTDMVSTVNGVPQEYGCYVRMVCDYSKYSASVVFCGVLLIMLSLTPGGKEKNHV